VVFKLRVFHDFIINSLPIAVTFAVYLLSSFALAVPSTQYVSVGYQVFRSSLIPGAC